MNSSKILSGVLNDLKKAVFDRFDLLSVLRSPTTHLERFASVLGSALKTHDWAIRELSVRLAARLECGPEVLAALVKSEAARMAEGLVRARPQALPWLEYFRSVERQFPGAIVLAHTRAIVQLAGLDDDRLPQVLARIPMPRRVEKATAEERNRQDLDWLAKVIEGVFAPVGLEAIVFVESLRTGKQLSQVRGAQFDKVLESLRSAPGSPSLDGDLFRIRNAIEHNTFSRQEGSFRLRSKKGKLPWSLEIPFTSIRGKGTEVLMSAADIALSMQVVMLESAPALILQPEILKVLIAALRGQDAMPHDAAATTAFNQYLRLTWGQLRTVS
jgi:hypothetical protein